MNSSKFEAFEFTEKSREEMLSRSRSFYEEMKARRSIREFSNRSVPQEVIKNALLTAGTAPNGANQQPWHFVVVSDSATKRKIRKAAEKHEKEFYQFRASEEWLKALEPFGTDDGKPFLETAPCLIVIFLKKFNVDENGKKHKNYYPMESVGIATGMLISALHLSGLVTLTHTPSPMHFLSDILERPDHERPFLILVTGYPAKEVSVPKIMKYSLDETTTFM